MEQAKSPNDLEDCSSESEGESLNGDGKMTESISQDGQGRLTKEQKKELFKPSPLDEPLRTWRELLKHIWTSSEEKEVRNELCTSVLYSIFEDQKNPYATAIELFKVSPDYLVQKKSSLAGFIIQRLKLWMEKSDNETSMRKLLTLDLKTEALKVAVAKHTVHLESVTEAYHLKEDDSMLDIVAESIREMLSKRRFRDAIICATEFSLQSRFSLEDMAIPCVLQDRLSLVEDYVKGDLELGKQLVSYFDYFIGRSEESVAWRVAEYRSQRIMTIPLSKLHGKSVEKMVSKLLSSLGLTQDIAPRLRESRARGGLRHIVQMYYVDGTIDVDNYRDYVKHALEYDKNLRTYFIDYLVKTHHYEDAAHWSLLFHLEKSAPISIIPYLSGAAARLEAEQSSSQTNTNTNPKIVELCPGHPIDMVDTPGKLKHLIGVLRAEPFIGVDTEWKPSYLCANEQVALIQVSIPNRSFLIDVMKLESVLHEDEWNNLFLALFCTDSSIKYGYDFPNDMRVLCNTFPFLKDLQPQMKNVICIMRVVISILSIAPDLIKLPFSRADVDGEMGGSDDQKIHFKLIDLCQEILGETLNKGEQVSDWAKRPLRKSQMLYAAMDAYCLLEISSVLKKKASEAELDWKEHLENGNITKLTKEPKKPKKSRKINEDEFREMIERVNASVCVKTGVYQRPRDVKVVVDSMILGLGKHLRRCGLDTVFGESRGDVIKIAREDCSRYVLSSGKAAIMMSKIRPLEGRVLSIPLDKLPSGISQIEFVLRRFNIVLSKDDIFSRCVVCNGDSFVLSPSPVLEAMYQSVVASRTPFADHSFDAISFRQKIADVDPDDYHGYGCSLAGDESNPSWIIVRCYRGIVDVSGCVHSFHIIFIKNLDSHLESIVLLCYVT